MSWVWVVEAMKNDLKLKEGDELWEMTEGTPESGAGLPPGRPWWSACSASVSISAQGFRSQENPRCCFDYFFG